MAGWFLGENKMLQEIHQSIAMPMSFYRHKTFAGPMMHF
jgi:hypothetical protein